MTINYQSYIVGDPAICGGEAVVRGTRDTIRTVLASLAEGMSVAEILRDFPTLDKNAVREVIAFAAVSPRKTCPFHPLHHVLERRGHEVDTVATEGLAGKPDVHVWAAARRDGYFFGSMYLLKGQPADPEHGLM